jgi:nitronate monooxygenase
MNPRSRLPSDWLAALDLPLIAAPMFLVSSVNLVAAACRNGVIGAMPAGNARTPPILDQWLADLTQRLAAPREEGCGCAPWALNLVVHRTNDRMPAELALCVKYRAPLVITALGSPKAVVDQVHAYGGRVFADVNSIDFAARAAATGVDGLVLIGAGAGGHTGLITAPAFVASVREFFDGVVVIAGGMTDGHHLRAAQAMGADLAYMGTRFIAATESSAVRAYKQMLVDSSYKDIISTSAITGALANKLRPSIVAAGLDPDNLKPRDRFDLSNRENDIKAWKDLWSAGHGVGRVKAIEDAARIIAGIKQQYAGAIAAERADAWSQKYSQD